VFVGFGLPFQFVERFILGVSAIDSGGADFDHFRGDVLIANDWFANNSAVSIDYLGFNRYVLVFDEPCEFLPCAIAIRLPTLGCVNFGYSYLYLLALRRKECERVTILY